MLLHRKKWDKSNKIAQAAITCEKGRIDISAVEGSEKKAIKCSRYVLGYQGQRDIGIDRVWIVTG